MSNRGVVSGIHSDLDLIKYGKYQNGRSALVTQGGGQCGIFTSGVLDAFLLSNFDPFDVFYGTSAGALNISAYLCRQPGIGKAFTLDLTTDDKFFHLFSYMRRKQSMDLDWALNKFRDYPYKLDLDMGRKVLRERQAFAAVTEVSSIKDRYIPLLSENWYDVMRATCAIPGLYSEEVIIEGKRFVDGGVTAAIPVQEAWRQGARNIIVIRTESLESEVEKIRELNIDVHWIKEPMNNVQDRWNKTVEQWKNEWSGFWQEQIDKSKQKKIHHKHLDILNGGRWLYGAGDVYRLSHLLGGKFDSGLADFFMVHYQSLALTNAFLSNPPDDCFIVQIVPSEPLKSSPLMSKKEDLIFDYELGLSAGYEFIKQHSLARKNATNIPESKCKY
ncbi:patatin family protein [Vibrio sp. F74]|uniref:patatin-like phospholipase family protein n=1 Tax=Vibrio sp. F74 TaxID=700020 RepID=UPI0035F54E25